MGNTGRMTSQPLALVANANRHLHEIALSSIQCGNYYSDIASGVFSESASDDVGDYVSDGVGDFDDICSTLQQSIDNTSYENRIGFLIRDRDPFTQADCIGNRRFRSAITRFISSDGMLVILGHTGFLWVDSRYFPSAKLHCTGTDVIPQLLVKPLDWVQTLTTNRVAEQQIGRQGHHSVNPHQTVPMKTSSIAVDSSKTSTHSDIVPPLSGSNIALFCDRLTTPVDEYSRWSNALPHHVRLIAVDYTASPFELSRTADGSRAYGTRQTDCTQWLVTHTERFFNTASALHNRTSHTKYRLANESNNSGVANSTSSNKNHTSPFIENSERTNTQEKNRRINKHKRRAFYIPSQFCDFSISHLLQVLRDELRKCECTHLIHSESADICWLLQIRGWDYRNNQLLSCALIIDIYHHTTLYCNPHSLTHYLKIHLRRHQIDIASIDNFARDVAAICSQSKQSHLLSHHSPPQQLQYATINTPNRHTGQRAASQSVNVANAQFNSSSHALHTDQSDVQASARHTSLHTSSSDKTPNNVYIKIAVDAHSTPLYIYQLVPPTIRHTPSLSFWSQQLYKKERVIAAITRAAIVEGCALVQFNVRLQRALATQSKQHGHKLTKQKKHARKHRLPITEHTVARMVYRAQQSYRSFLQPSFDSIVGYMAHGAFIHYNHRQEPTAAIDRSGILLLDCGGHYRYGTTDITRVLLCGIPTAQHINDYTYVLKALIAGSTVTVKDGSNGATVDSHTREQLQRHGLDYAHGTGHGIGQCYNVHLGTEGLSPRSTMPLIRDGYVCSMEPGLYRIGEHGIRLENMIVFVPTLATEPQYISPNQAVLHNTADSPKPNSTLAPYTITRFPFERGLIDNSLLTEAERNWINAYHAQVHADLAPHLSRRYRQWLHKATAVLP